MSGEHVTEKSKFFAIWPGIMKLYLLIVYFFHDEGITLPNIDR
ncbi:MAG: hypothetical protein JWO03_2438 [Bacteroidetes bacterium]|nr:hypothetical protein [Bacteroidota bacterium]